MKSYSTKRFSVSSVSASLIFALLVSCSYVALASSAQPVGEIVVSGQAGPNGPNVTVNGEPVMSSRTIFNSSSISTPEGLSAVISLGKSGRLQLAPGSSIQLEVSGDSVSGSLAAGNVSVLNAPATVAVRTADGEMIAATAGESVSATGAKTASKAQTRLGGLSPWVWAAIVGGAVATVLIITLRDDDDDNVTSPVR